MSWESLLANGMTWQMFWTSLGWQDSIGMKLGRYNMNTDKHCLKSETSLSLSVYYIWPRAKGQKMISQETAVAIQNASWQVIFESEMEPTRTSWTQGNDAELGKWPGTAWKAYCSPTCEFHLLSCDSCARSSSKLLPNYYLIILDLNTTRQSPWFSAGLWFISCFGIWILLAISASARVPHGQPFVLWTSWFQPPEVGPDRARDCGAGSLR